MTVTSVVLAPHNDDETLFASFLLQWHRADLVVCLRSFVQESRGTGIHYSRREAETAAAWAELTAGDEKAHERSFVQWGYPDATPAWGMIRTHIRELAERYDHVIAPAVEETGHEHHNLVGGIALEEFGKKRTTAYLTYTRAGGRSRGEPVYYRAEHVQAKLRALACYGSQIEEPSCRPHFLGSLEEYVA